MFLTLSLRLKESLTRFLLLRIHIYFSGLNKCVKCLLIDKTNNKRLLVSKLADTSTQS